MPLRWVFACVLLLTALLAPARGGATTCEQPTLAGARSNADIVVVGRVGKVSPDGLRFAFAVERVHKGAAPPSIEIWAGGMKGAMLTSGTRTVVFLRLAGEPGSQTLFAHLCGNPFGDKQVKEWIQKLGKGAPPSAAGSAPTSGKPGAAALSSAAPDPDPEPPPPAPSASAATPAEPSASAAPPDPAASASSPPGAPAPSPAGDGEPRVAPPKGGCAGCAQATSPRGGPRSLDAAAGLVCALGLSMVARKRRARGRRPGSSVGSRP